MKTETKKRIAAVFFPERCPYCREIIRPLEIACENCSEGFPKTFYEKTVFGGFRAISALPYKENYAGAVKRLKFNKKKQYAYQMAKLMAQSIEKAYCEIKPDFVTCVPLHEKDYKERGFNQSEVLAKFIGEFLDLEYKSFLVKTKQNEPQHTVKAHKKQNNVKGVYKSINKNQLKGKSILLIDDVVTTGFTLGECAKTLTKAGAEIINCATFAITLPKTT